MNPMKKQWLLLVGLVSLFPLSSVAEKSDLEGKQFFLKGSRGNEYFYVFRDGRSYLRKTPEVGTEMGRWVLLRDGRGEYVQFYGKGLSMEQVRRSPDHKYYYTLVTSNIVAFYDQSTLMGVYFPRYWTFLEGEYTAGSEEIDPKTSSRFSSHYAENLYYPQNEALQNLKWFWSEDQDNGGDRSVKITFPSPSSGAGSNREGGCYVRGAVIMNGVFASEEEYQRRGRVKDGMFLFPSGEMKEVTLEDTPEPQAVFFESYEEPVTEATFFINSVYPGEETEAAAMTRLIYFGETNF